MATIEQCKAGLHKRLKTVRDAKDFIDEWGGVVPTGIGDRQRFIRKIIDSIVANAHRDGKLDMLGLKLELPSDSEASRLNTVSTNRRSWIAIIIAAVALIMSIMALLKPPPAP